MTDPLGELSEALDGEYGPRPRVAALATVDPAGRPRVRSVVCRRVGPGRIWVASDARSAKNAEVRTSPSVELAFWLPGRREQFRIAGRAEILAGADRQAAWERLSDSARALFCWPAPGTPRVDGPDAYPATIPAEGPIPAAFELLAIEPEAVESLDLKPHPHRRRRFRRAGADWTVEELNP